MSPALAGGFLTTGPLKKSQWVSLLKFVKEDVLRRKHFWNLASTESPNKLEDTILEADLLAAATKQREL